MVWGSSGSFTSAPLGGENPGVGVEPSVCETIPFRGANLAHPLEHFDQHRRCRLAGAPRH